MTNDESQSTAFAAHVLAEVGAGRLPLLATNDVGERCVVTALDDEPMSALFERVDRAGGYATAFLKLPTGVMVVPFRKSDGALGPRPAEGLDMAVDAESTVGMFAEFLTRHPEGVSLHVSGPHRLPAVARPGMIDAGL